MKTEPLDILDAALQVCAAGCSVIPVNHRTKRPLNRLLPKDERGKPVWGPFLERAAEEPVVRGWFAAGAKSFAVVCGGISGGLLVLDFDVERFYLAWVRAVGSLADGLPAQRTGGGRYQVFCRCAQPGANTQLAWVEDATAKSGRKIAIETRGQGGYAVVPPSLHPSGTRYAWISGDLPNVPLLPQAHADALIAAARKLDECPYTKQERQKLEADARGTYERQSRASRNGSGSVIEQFNRAHQIDTLLEHNGYTRCGERLVRPGGKSPSVSIKDGKSCHFSSNDPLNDGKVRSGIGVHDAFDVYTYFEHSGDTNAAVKAAALSLGIEPPSRHAASGSADSKPKVLIDTDEHRAVNDAVTALTDDPEIFQRGGALARVLRGDGPGDGVRRGSRSATIGVLPAASLRERLTKFATFVRMSRRGEEAFEVPAHPSPWLVSAVEARGFWPGVRHLQGLSNTPVLRPDGTVWQTPGYDERTGVLYEPSGGFPSVPEDAELDDADAAVEALKEVVADFRFESEDHRSAWFAGLLTPFARHAFDGPAPLFLIDANVRGAGKGLLGQTIGQIVLGDEMPVSSYAHDPEEMRKKVTAIALAGDRLVHLDNLEGSFGNATLDRALTSTRWKDRVLGKSHQVDLPLLAVWYGTGNNVAVAADTTRRIIHIRLDVLEERPEERTDFRHPDLLAWIRQNRPTLLCHALTILVAYCNAGRPGQGLSAFGSFEGWSALVREALVWAGLSDPCLTRTRLAETSDTTADSLGRLIRAWEAYDAGDGIVVSELVAPLYPAHREQAPNDDVSVQMRAALEQLAGGVPGKVPSARQLGNKLRSFRRRVIGGAYLDTRTDEYNRNGAVWRVHHV